MNKTVNIFLPGDHRFPIGVCLVCLIVSTVGCLPTQNITDLGTLKNKTLIDEVSFQTSKRKYYCGPEALSPILTYYGKPSTPETIGKALMTEDERGVNIVELKSYAEKEGLRTEIRKGNIELIETSIDEKRPIIVLVEISDKQDVGLFFGAIPVFRVNALYHFYTVVGYSDQYVIVLGPNGRAGIHKEDLVEIWKPMKFATLELWPPASESK